VFKIRKLLRWQVQILLVLAVALIALRIALPSIVKWYVNKTIDEMPDYSGQIGDVDMKLWRGAYQIQDIEIFKTSGAVPVPFFAASNVEFSVQWKALFEGALVAEIEFFDPVINFVAGPTEETSQVGVDKPWLDVIKKLFPLDINRFEVHRGSIHYRDFYSTPKVDLELDRIHALATNLTNSKKLSKTLVADIQADGRAFHESGFELTTKLDPSTDRPTFDLDLRLDPVSLTKLNDFVEAYGRFDFEAGTLALAIELAAKDGAIRGYLKPVLDGMKIVNLEREIRNPLDLLWQSAVAGVTRLFRNQPNNRLATKIPISGSLDDPRVAILPTLGNILKNEFVRVFDGDLEDTVSLEDVPAKPARESRSDSGKAAPTAPRLPPGK